MAGLSPTMFAVLEWLASPATVGNPGSRCTLDGLRWRGLARVDADTGLWTLTEPGRIVLASRAN